MQQSEISKSLFRKINTFFVLALLNFSLAFAQEKIEVDFHFETDSIAVEKGSTFTNFLVIKNKSAEVVTIQNINPQEQYPGLLFYPKTDFTLIAGESKRLPIKMIADVDFMKMKSSEIKFNLIYTSSTTTKGLTSSFFVQKEENKNIAIYTLSQDNYINPATPESSILLFVENRGYSKRSIKLEFQSIPEGLEIFPKQQIVSLEGLEKQMLEIKISVRKQNTLFPEYNIQATATDVVDNKMVGSNIINALILSNNRQISRGIESGRGTNFAEIGYNQNSSGFNYAQLRGNTEFQVAENLNARLNLGTDYYLQDGLYNIYDTWLELERKNTAVRVGNVNGSDYDYSISGRGGKITTKFGEKNEIELLALENNYNLYGTYFPQGEGSKMAGVKYSFGKTKNFTGKISYLYDNDPRQSIDTQVANIVTSLIMKDQHNLRTELGLSHEKGLVNNDENIGASAGVNYDTRMGKWDFQSVNSYGTNSYAGLNRGSFFSSQRLGREFTGSHRAFVQYQSSQVDPEFLSNQNVPIQIGNTINFRSYSNSTQALRTGYQFSLKNWNFLISPQVENQRTANYFTSQELFSYRLQTNIGTTFGSHGINWTAEYSYSKQDSQPDWFNSLKTTLSYRYKSFSLNGTAQWNANNVYDLNFFSNSDRNFANYNLYASYNFKTQNNSLTASFSAGGYYSELYKNLNSNINGNVEYKISPSWSTTGYFNFSGYKSTDSFAYSGSNYQFRVGIKKYFIASTALGNHKVSFQFFEDKNFNGQLDSGEVVLKNEIVKLDQFVAMTDQNGKVVFQNVPKGIYQLRVNESKGSRLMMDPVINVEKNINRKVGMVKNIKVTGKLVEIKQAYDILGTDVTGIVVYAKSEDDQIYTAVVNQNNEFEFFLKDGRYDIYIENDKYSYTQPKQTIQVAKEGYSGGILFEYKKKDTTIKVKKF